MIISYQHKFATNRQLSRLPKGRLEEKLVVVELGGQQGFQQLEGYDGGEPPDGVGRTKVHWHAVACMALQVTYNIKVRDDIHPFRMTREGGDEEGGSFVPLELILL